MKVRIKSGNCPDYLSHNRFYDIEHKLKDGILIIKEDSGGFIDIKLSKCTHLKGGAWEIVDE